MVCPAAVVVGCCMKASLFGAPAFTWNELLVPVAGLSVAVMVKLPVLVMVTLSFASTPFVKGVVIGAPTRVPVRGKLHFEAIAAVTDDSVVTRVLSSDPNVECGARGLGTADRIERKVINCCAGNDSKCDGIACSLSQATARCGDGYRTGRCRLPLHFATPAQALTEPSPETSPPPIVLAKVTLNVLLVPVVIVLPPAS